MRLLFISTLVGALAFGCMGADSLPSPQSPAKATAQAKPGTERATVTELAPTEGQRPESSLVTKTKSQGNADWASTLTSRRGTDASHAIPVPEDYEDDAANITEDNLEAELAALEAELK